MAEQGGLINCKKCGTLFIKGSRDICDNCFKAEMEVVDTIKSFVMRNPNGKTTLEEIITGCNISKVDLEDLIEKGRLFSIMPKLIIKCKFCGIEIEGDQKTNFVCSKCLQKFSPKGELAKINALKEEQEQLEVEKAKPRRSLEEIENQKARFGFIQNYSL